MIKDQYQVIRMRHRIKVRRKENRVCPQCGKLQKCEPWCRGPKILQYIQLIIKGHNYSTLKVAWRLYKNELKWAGVEPWHRY